MTSDQAVGLLVIIGVALLLFRPLWQRARLQRQLQAVGPQDADPELLATGLFGLLLTNRLGLDEETQRRCVSSVTNAELAAHLGDPLLAYACILFRDEMIEVYGVEAAEKTWDLFGGELEALAKVDDDSSEVAGLLAFWIDNLMLGKNVFNEAGADRMEVLEISPDMCLAAGVWQVHKQHGLEHLWIDDPSGWMGQLEQIGAVFARARAETEGQIRASVRLLGVEEQTKDLRAGLKDRPIPNPRVSADRDEDRERAP